MAHMARYDVYGIRNGTLEDTAAFIEETLGLSMSMRDSMYLGIYYHARDPNGREYLLQINEKGVTGKYADMSEFKLLFSVNDVPNMDEIGEKLMAARDDIALIDSNSFMVKDDEDYDDEEDSESASSDA